jgi:hypothetical protein
LPFPNAASRSRSRADEEIFEIRLCPAIRYTDRRQNVTETAFVPQRVETRIDA